MRCIGRWVVLVVFDTLLSLLSPCVHASSTCNSANNNNTLAAGTISVPVGMPIGATALTLAPINYIAQCKFLPGGTNVTSSVLTGQLSIATAPASGFSDVYPTGIPGLGVRYTLNSTVDQCNLANQTIQNGMLQFKCSFTGPIGGPYIPYTIYITASLVVTGPIPYGATTLSSAPVVAYALYSDDTGGPWPHQPAYSGAASGILSHATCSVSQTSIAVDLPTADSHNLTSVGATTAPRAFALALSCQTGATVLITLTDSVNPANRSNALQLTADSTATGVGIQIVNSSGTPVSFGPDSAAPGNTNQWSIGASPNGTLQVPLTARYVRTGNVSAGSVRALATFTMSYQ